MVVSPGDLLFAKAAVSVVKVNCVQGRATTKCVGREILFLWLPMDYFGKSIGFFV